MEDGWRLDREWMDAGWRMGEGWMEDHVDIIFHGGWVKVGWTIEGGSVEDGWRLDGSWMIGI